MYSFHSCFRCLGGTLLQTIPGDENALFRDFSSLKIFAQGFICQPVDSSDHIKDEGDEAETAKSKQFQDLMTPAYVNRILSGLSLIHI